MYLGNNFSKWMGIPLLSAQVSWLYQTLYCVCVCVSSFSPPGFSPALEKLFTLLCSKIDPGIQVSQRVRYFVYSISTQTYTSGQLAVLCNTIVVSFIWSQERIRRRSVYNRVSAALRCKTFLISCYSELGLSLCFVACSCLPLHPPCLILLVSNENKRALSQSSRSPSYSRKVLQRTRPDFSLLIVSVTRSFPLYGPATVYIVGWLTSPL